MIFYCTKQARLSYDFLLFCLLMPFSDQRNLGMSMKVERSTLDQVKKRFELNKRKMEDKKKDYDFEERMKELKEEVRMWLTSLWI